jgi:starch-binding outer membrane protein, SusD/RagB family
MKKILTIILLGSLLSGCKDILDISPQDRVGENAVWADVAFVRAYQSELYNAIPTNFGVHMYAKLTDEAYNSVPANQGPELFKLNSFNPDNIAIGSNSDNNFIYYWNRGYQYIRKINIFLDKMAAPDAVVITNKAQLIAEAKFLRAFIYFNLAERYNGASIVKEVYELGDTHVFERSSFDAVVAFIEEDLAAAIPDLPTKYSSTDGNFGRATKDAAYALLSRTLLYAASPLNNPGNDLAKWQKARDAARMFIDNGDRGYVLYSNYGTLFNQNSAAHQNEYIFARNFTSSNAHQAPMHNLPRRYNGYGGWWASIGPSQNLVDDYDMTNGQPPFVWSGNTKTINPASGYDAANPYTNRDPRLAATAIYDGAVFRGDTFQMWVESSAVFGSDSWRYSSDNNRSGYSLRKFMPESGTLDWQTWFTIPWPHFRLAEIYLNYAEAMFELGDENACRTYLSRVRARVGMPAIPATVTGAELRTRLYNERRIELAYEGHRFFDIRRWKIAATIENRPIFGMDVLRNPTTKVKTYQPVLLLQKNAYQDRMNYLPVEANEIRRNAPELQTPGW